MERRQGLLRGWKEIEAYLRLGRKAIMRQRFPVRSSGRSVYAIKGELDAFLECGERHATQKDRK